MHMMNAKPSGRSNRGLTSREREILVLAAKGLTRSQIAGQLGLQLYTISSHLKKIHRKLGVHNRAAAVAVFLRQGAGDGSRSKRLPASQADMRRRGFLSPLQVAFCPHCGGGLPAKVMCAPLGNEAVKLFNE